MADNKPTHRLLHVSERQSRDRKTVRTVYTEITGVWQTEKGNLSLTIPEGITLSGQCLLVPADKPAPAAADEPALSDT